MRQPHDELVLAAAKRAGCSPEWFDGLFGPAWHCGCRDNLHGIDQQCSLIDRASLRRQRR